MNRLKNLLQYDAGKFIHVGFLLLTYIFSKTSYLAIGLFFVSLIYLFRKSKRLVIYGLVLVLITTIRFEMIDVSEEMVSETMVGTVTEVNENSFRLSSDADLLCYYDDVSDLVPGMVVSVSGTIYQDTDYQIMNTFDYDMYLKSSGIEAIMWVDQLDVKSIGFNIHQIPYKISQYIKSHFDETSSVFLCLFLLGEKSDSEVLNPTQINQLGISHLFAISGLHLGLLVGFLSNILKRFYWTKETNRIIILVFLAIYNIITGFKISILRASLLIVGIYVIDTFRILLGKPDLITLSFLGFVIWNPYIVYNLGFQLSYLIVLALLLSEGMWPTTKPLSKIIRTTLIATLFSFPIVINVNHIFGLVFLYSNLVFIIYITYLFLPASMVTVFIPAFEPVYLVFANGFLWLIALFDSINVVVPIAFPNTFILVLFYLFLIGMFLGWQYPKKRLLAMLGILALLFSSYLLPYPSNRFVRFFDVGQGDAIQIHDNGCDMLIDTGNVDRYDHLLEYFESHNRSELDIVLITHFHMDHYGELTDFLQRMEIKKVFLNQPMDSLPNGSVLKEGDTFSCGTSRFQVLSANHNDSNENNNSIVLYGVIGPDTYLFTGDIEAKVEEELVNQYQIPLTVLKVAHHGSSTSSTERFLAMADPDYVIVSVGKDNSYGQPDDMVIDLLEHYSSSLYRTDVDGTITFYYYDLLHLRVVETYRHQKRRIFDLAMV
ncbi:MAG: DNA internalization-related competence protein ComEC/Rec2 [Bacilli bacterium]|nr:DNA internalization-related competence protein ComEC/Rec2 [Bacilli bacterium]MBN2876802.1 DNA internalization-related competence protein ComEC/Rec2 [Bacilli bacterium]